MTCLAYNFVCQGEAIEDALASVTALGEPVPVLTSGDARIQNTC